MYNEQLEQLIDAALADGALTEKEKQILFKKAQAMGVDLDEFEMVLDAWLVKLKKAEEEKSASSAPKSNKLGDVKKCPSCGAMVQSYQGVCPECGYAFEGVDANSAVKELSSLLQKTTEKDKMEKIIDNYPIPMEKAALMAFITWLRPQSTDAKNPLANSYFKKYSECVNKIRVSFANDKDLQSILSYYDGDAKIIRNQKIVRFTLKNKWFWVGVAVLTIIVLIIKPKPINKNPEKTNSAIIAAIESGDYKKAQEYILDYRGRGTIDAGEKALAMAINSAIISAVDENKLNEARDCVLNYVDVLKDRIKPGIERLTSAYVKEGMLDQAKLVGAKYADEVLVKGYLENGLYDEYMKYADFETTGEFIRDVIVDLCKKGKKKDAINFLNSYSSNISDRYDNLGLGSYPTKDGGTSIKGDRAYVTKKLKEMINNY